MSHTCQPRDPAGWTRDHRELSPSQSGAGQAEQCLAGIRRSAKNPAVTAGSPPVTVISAPRTRKSTPRLRRLAEGRPPYLRTQSARIDVAADSADVPCHQRW